MKTNCWSQKNSASLKPLGSRPSRECHGANWSKAVRALPRLRPNLRLLCDHTTTAPTFAAEYSPHAPAVLSSMDAAMSARNADSTVLPIASRIGTDRPGSLICFFFFFSQRNKNNKKTTQSVVRFLTDCGVIRTEWNRACSVVHEQHLSVLHYFPFSLLYKLEKGTSVKFLMQASV